MPSCYPRKCIEVLDWLNAEGAFRAEGGHFPSFNCAAEDITIATYVSWFGSENFCRGANDLTHVVRAKIGASRTLSAWKGT